MLVALKKNKMKKIKSVLAAFVLLFTFIQCDSQTKKTTTMKNSNSTETSPKEIIVDVRTVEEWNEDGHADCSVNYPLDKFDSKIEELKKFDKVVIVCRSGNRSGIAKKKLLDAGYTKEVENLGSWKNIKCKTK